MKKLTTFIAIALALILLGYIFKDSLLPEKPAHTETITPPVQNNRVMSIESYVTSNISDLSPEKEVLGGTYYVTSIQTENGKGVVSYEDGHNAHTADFTYTLNVDTGIVITSWDIR